MTRRYNKWVSLRGFYTNIPYELQIRRRFVDSRPEGLPVEGIAATQGRLLLLVPKFHPANDGAFAQEALQQLGIV